MILRLLRSVMDGIGDWSERHRPKSTDDLVGNSEAIGKIRAWLNKWADGNIPQKRGMLLVGPQVPARRPSPGLQPWILVGQLSR